MKMERMIVIDLKKCTGCKICEMVCSFTNEQKFDCSKARIQNFGDLKEAFFASITCMQCEDPPCAKVCPSLALKREEAAVRVEESRCIGCKLCLLACPFGAIHLDKGKKSIYKCELCDGSPACVNYCPTGALQYKEVETREMEKSRIVFGRLRQAYLQCKFE